MATSPVNSINRIIEIDYFRGATIILMVFVNSLDLLADFPRWLDHAKVTQDAIGLADFVFPWFLFAVGLSIPHALARKLGNPHASAAPIIGGVLFRTLGLLTMGLFLENAALLDRRATSLPAPVFNALMFVGFFLVWNAYPRHLLARKLVVVLKLAGILLLLYLAFIFRGAPEPGSVFMHPRWWGILGQIGWSYLLCTLLLIVFRQRSVAVLLMTLMVLIAFNFLSAGPAPHYSILAHTKNWFVGLGSFQACTILGALVSLLVLRPGAQMASDTRLPWLAWSGGALLVIGILTRTFYPLSKIQATPPWLFITLGTALLLLFAFCRSPRINNLNWLHAPLVMTGQNALTCYLVPMAAKGALTALGVSLPAALATGLPGLLTIAVLTLILLAAVRLLEHFHIKLAL